MGRRFVYGTSGSVHLNEDIYMVTETMIHIRKRIDLLLNVKDAEKNRRQLILTDEAYHIKAAI